MISLTVDDRKVSVEPGTRLLEACQALGIELPTLCHHRSLPAYGACRLCLVEVEERGRVQIQPSCLYSAREGLVVRTATERVLSSVAKPVPSLGTKNCSRLALWLTGYSAS